MLFAYNIKRLEKTPLEKTSEPKHQIDWHLPHLIESHNWHTFEDMPHKLCGTTNVTYSISHRILLLVWAIQTV